MQQKRQTKPGEFVTIKDTIINLDNISTININGGTLTFYLPGGLNNKIAVESEEKAREILDTITENYARFVW